MVLGLIAAVVLAHGSVIKAVAMVILGLLLGLVGTDGQSGGVRFSFGLTMLSDGIGFVPLAIGVFGVGEVIANLLAPAAEPFPDRQEDHRHLADARGFPPGLAGGRCAAPRSARFSASSPAAVRH